MAGVKAMNAVEGLIKALSEEYGFPYQEACEKMGLVGGVVKKRASVKRKKEEVEGEGEKGENGGKKEKKEREGVKERKVATGFDTLAAAFERAHNGAENKERTGALKVKKGGELKADTYEGEAAAVAMETDSEAAVEAAVQMIEAEEAKKMAEEAKKAEEGEEA